MQRLRLRYARRGRLRFSSHRDFQRALERALRRAGVPIAFSAGFSPHPKVSYLSAAATGVASEAEYVELGLAQRREPDEVRAALDAALPDGLDVLEVVEAGPGSLAERLEASVFRLELPGVGAQRARHAVDALLAASTAQVVRMTAKGSRTLDARAAIVALTVDTAAGEPVAQSADCAILRLVVRHTTPAVRPDDVVAALTLVDDLVPPEAPRATRLAQGPLDVATAQVGDPLAADRS